jgi:hypothetical protein
MSFHRQFRITAGVIAPAFLGWALYCAAALVVHHDSINYRIADAGFGFVSIAAEELFALGPFASAALGFAAGFPTMLVCLRGVGPILPVAVLNLLAVLIVLCGLGSMNGGIFAASAGLGILGCIFARRGQPHARAPHP